MLEQLASSIHPTVMASMNSLYTEITHPFVQEAQKTVEWSHAGRKSTHESSSARRDSSTVATYTGPTSTAELYVTNFGECWYSSTNDQPFKNFWANKAKTAANNNGSCGQCAYDRIAAVPFPQQRFEYNRLGSLSWETYGGDRFYAEQARQRVLQYSSNFNGRTNTAQNDVYNHIMTLPDWQRGMEFSNFESIKWASVPSSSTSATFWAYYGYKNAGWSNKIYNRIMRTDSQYRGLAYSYLQTMNWSDYGGGNTFWADDVWQYMADQDYDQKIAQKAYDTIMSYSKGSRVMGFKYYLDNEKIFLTCQDQVISYESYTDPVTGDYFDPFYDVGNGTFTDIGKQLQKVDWEEAGTIALIIGAYLALALAGFFVFPPFAICLVLTEGNLNDCSLGVWGNGYAADQTKFDITAEEVAPVETAASTTENAGATTFVVDTAAATSV